MNALDVVVLVAVAVGAFVGFRVGFVVRALSWLGLVDRARGRAPAHAAPRALAHRQHAGRPPARGRVAPHRARAASGTRTGLVASQTIRNRYSLPEHVAPLDRFTGGVLGALGALRVALAAPPGAALDAGLARAGGTRLEPRRRARPATHRTSRTPRASSDGSSARRRTRCSSDAPRRRSGHPPPTPARSSTPPARGPSCSCAAPRAGSSCRAPASRSHRTSSRRTPTWWRGRRHTSVITVDGTRRDATVVRFDGRHDIAILRVDGPPLPVLTLGPTTVGTVASVLGHPNGGHLRGHPGTRRPADRHARAPTSTAAARSRPSIVGLAAHLIVGDSGAPVVGPDGTVAGHGVRDRPRRPRHRVRDQQPTSSRRSCARP